VIDDDARLREHYRQLLKLEGYDVVEVRNGREGVERARPDATDLVLCDISMPEMNGHRVLETLRSEPRLSHVPVVFLTGWSEAEDIRTGMNLGADDYLKKPVVPDELVAAAASGRKAKRAGEAKPEELESLGLTPREAEVLFWVARGKTNDEIATVLGIGLTTVKKHLESTYSKLGVENRTTAAAMALEHLG
jgi:DNA-binding NarL/FixJ family response regulator